MPEAPSTTKNPTALVIGSGSIGTVVGHHLSRGGARVISLVRSATDTGRRTIHQLDGSSVTWTPDLVTQDVTQDAGFDVIIVAIQGLMDLELADRIRSRVKPGMPEAQSSPWRSVRCLSVYHVN